MKKTIYLILTACIGLSDCKTAGNGNDMKLGGYVDQSITSPHVQRAYHFAMAQMTLTESDLAFLSLVKARTQAVEGTKFELTCNVKKNNAEKTLLVYVYENLQQKQEITEFKFLDK